MAALPFTKILITNGWNDKPSNTNIVEVLDITDPINLCEDLQKFPQDSISYAFGGLGYRNEPIICGGASSDASEFSKVKPSLATTCLQF
jgi:hypothetical protein